MELELELKPKPKLGWVCRVASHCVLHLLCFIPFCAALGHSNRLRSCSCCCSCCCSVVVVVVEELLTHFKWITHIATTCINSSRPLNASALAANCGKKIYVLLSPLYVRPLVRQSVPLFRLFWPFHNLCANKKGDTKANEPKEEGFGPLTIRFAVNIHVHVWS